MRPILVALPLILTACSTPAPVPSTSVVPPIRQYDCAFALAFSGELTAIMKTAPHVAQFVADSEKLRYANAAARGEPDPQCRP